MRNNEKPPRQPPRHIYRQPNVLGTRVTATVKWFDPVRGFGFIKPADGSADALLPGAMVGSAGHDTLPEGATVVVDLIEGKKGAQVSVLHSVDTSTATPARAPRGGNRDFGGGNRDFGNRDRGFGDRPPRSFDDRPPRSFDDRGPPRRSAPSAAPSGPTSEIEGTVKFFNADKGFGFITPDGGGKDVFVHVRALERSGMTTLNEKQRVRASIRQSEKGPEAVSVTEA